MNSPDLILRRGLFTTLDRGNPTASAVAITDGVFTAVGHDVEVMKLVGPSTKVIDLRGRRVLPGLIDNHLHIIRGGLNFNMELRWDGVWSLADAMAMLKKQVAITPPPQWVRVVGGFTEHQFAEKRLPTIDELNAAAPDTPVFILHLYDRATEGREAGLSELDQHVEVQAGYRLLPTQRGRRDAGVLGGRLRGFPGAAS
jgi:predicted amidohydrolase YtcJ